MPVTGADIRQDEAGLNPGATFGVEHEEICLKIALFALKAGLLWPLSGARHGRVLSAPRDEIAGVSRHGPQRQRRAEDGRIPANSRY